MLKRHERGRIFIRAYLELLEVVIQVTPAIGYYPAKGKQENTKKIII